MVALAAVLEAGARSSALWAALAAAFGALAAGLVIVALTHGGVGPEPRIEEPGASADEPQGP